jgi:hypothetical protein
MKKSIASIVFLPFVLMSLSCGESDDIVDFSTGGSPNVILPLQVGNTWLYRRTSFDTEGFVLARDTVAQRIARDTLIQDERWYIWEATSGLSLGTSRSDGYWTYVEGMPAITLRYPVVVHETYMITETGPTIHILAVDTLIGVPFGTAPCIAYEQLSFPGGTRMQIDYYAVNTGLIRTDEFVHTSSGADSLRHRWDLLELQLH